MTLQILETKQYEEIQRTITDPTDKSKINTLIYQENTLSYIANVIKIQDYCLGYKLNSNQVDTLLYLNQCIRHLEQFANLRQPGVYRFDISQEQFLNLIK